MGTHVFTKAKVEDSQSSSHGMLKFDLIKKTYTLQNLTEEGNVSMMEDKETEAIYHDERADMRMQRLQQQVQGGRRPADR